jgi:ATP-dependent Lon protease
MSPFIIKNKKKIPKMTASQLSALFRVSAPKYKRHSDDPRPDPEIEDSGDEKSSEASASSSSSASSTIASPVSRRKSSSKTHNLIVLDEANCWGGGSASSSKHKKSALNGGGGTMATSAAKMAVGKIAEALASSIIAAAAASKYKKKSADIIKRRREQEDDDEEEFSESEHDDEECSEEESGEESEENSDEDSEAAEDSDDDDDESDDSDSDYDDDEDEDDDDSEFDDDSSEGDDERTQKKNKKKQAAMEEQCAKNRQKLADIKSAIQKMTELSASDAMTSNKFMKKQIEEMKQKQRNLEVQLHLDEKKRDKLNVKEFKTLLRKKNSTNDLRYFRRHMNPEEQQKVIRDLKEIHAVSIIQKPYRLTLLETDIPIAFKAIAMRKINSLRHMEPGCGEYYKVKNWVDTFMKIPFNKRKNLPLTIEDGIQKCSEFMEASKTTLDHAVYGLNDAKLQVMQMLGQWISNPTAMGSAIAIQGPMGTGKTSLVKEGISKILGRDFAFIALGGATDSSFLEGHSYTYEGSTWGKIVEIIIQCGSMNPVIYFDELDKISETAKGEEIVGILTHLTDTSQNAQFHDRYFAEIDFDLSKCLFIFSYNDESKVNPILLDRMYRINTTGYNKKDKTQIAQKYLIPKICTQVGFREGDVVIPDSVIEHIVESYTEKEEGVRNLKRCLEVVHRKLNLYRLIKPDTALFEKELSLKVSFPFAVTNEVVDKLIKQSTESKRANLSLYL